MIIYYSRYSVTNTPLSSFIFLWLGLKHGQLINSRPSKKFEIKRKFTFSVNTKHYMVPTSPLIKPCFYVRHNSYIAKFLIQLNRVKSE